MMPIGSGIDIVEVERIKSILAQKNGGRFMRKVLHARELEECQMHANQAAYLAKRFAVKEAMAKALGTGIGSHLAFTDMYVEHDALGKPMLKFTAECEQRLNLQDQHILLSIADESAYAVAHVMLFAKVNNTINN